MQATAGAAAPKKKMSEYLKGWIPYRIQRYYLFVGITVISLVLPFIKINGNHFFLLNFDHKQLHLMFVRFDMQELYLMPFLLMILFLGIFFLTALGGRVWCGWACPQTIFRVIYRDLFETKLLGLRKRITNKQKDPDWSKSANKAKGVVAILLWTLLSLVAAANFIWYFVPPEDFFAYLSNAGEHGTLMGFWLGLTAFLVADVIWMKESFCVYVCPYSRVQSVLFDDDTVMAVYDYNRGGHIYDESKEKQFTKQRELLKVDESAECTTCESCVTVCPTHIDIRKGLQLECINCLECVDACTKVMGALGKESLVRWSSPREAEKMEGKTRYIRFKTIAYAAILTVVTVALFVMGSKKEHMLLNINKTTQLYRIDGAKVYNDYVFLFQNTDAKDHRYYFEIIGQPDIKIDRPSKPFKLRAGQKSKKVVTLEAVKPLVQDDRKDTPITIGIKAYAIDDKEKIIVDRNTVFVYPRWDIYQKEAKQ